MKRQISAGRHGSMAAFFLAAALCAGAAGCAPAQELTDTQALEALSASVSYDGQQVSFTLPEGERDWSLRVYGRAETQELGGISLHYLEEEGCDPGAQYSFALDEDSARDVTSLTLNAFAGQEELDLDLLPYLAG